jgi:dimethylaniline monooxygenase (N-oxide forming)
MKPKPHIVIIGAGPSGLVALKTILETHEYAATVLESTGEIGGTFRHKSYDDGSLVSSRLLTAFSDFRFTGEASNRDHPTIPQYLHYLDEYAEHFHLYEHIQFHSYVHKIDRMANQSNGKYLISFNMKGKSNTIFADAVCVCSGLHNVPSIPHIDRFDQFTGESFHSESYKEKSIFRSKKVLVVGAGETGMDIAYRSVIGRADSVMLSARSGFLSVPHEWYKNAPLDSFITNLFECCYQHRWMEYMKIKWNFTTPFIRLGFFIASGTSKGWNQWALTKTTTVARGHHIINKSVKAMAYINRPIKKKSFFGRWVYSLLDDATIDECPDINTTYSIPVKVLNKKYVEFNDGTIMEFDLIVFCTGYKQKFPFLYNTNDDEGGQKDDPLPNVHNIIREDEPTLSFIGFIRPNVGAIPPMSEMQVMWWLLKMKGKLHRKVKPSYHLLGNNKRTGSYSCDYGAYMHDLAREMGTAPNLFRWLFKSPKIALGYALGQSYPTYFRLEGEYYSDKSKHIAETELWEPVRARPIITNCLFTSIILLFGVLNGLCFVVDMLLFKQF